MATVIADGIVPRGKAIYEERLRVALEATSRGKFVAIEPDSGDYYLGRTLSEAVGAARAVHPDRVMFAIRVSESVVAA